MMVLGETVERKDRSQGKSHLLLFLHSPSQSLDHRRQDGWEKFAFNKSLVPALLALCLSRKVFQKDLLNSLTKVKNVISS